MMPPTLASERLAGIPFVMVAGAQHALATWKDPIPKTELAKHVQLVLTDRTELSRGQESFVMSHSTWRLADLFTKHAFLLDGLGWGGMPGISCKANIDAGRLVILPLDDFPAGGPIRPIAAAYPADTPPGPAGRWMIDKFHRMIT